MNQKNILVLFNKAIAGKEVSFETINKEAFKRGYLVSPECCTTAVLEWLREQPVDFNATFYKEWTDIESKSRLEIWLDQVSNYLTNYRLGYSTVPNDGSEQPEYNDFKIIEPISVDEVQSRALSLLTTKVAMKQETIDMVLSVVDFKKIDIDAISNKEAKMIICEYTNLVPNDPAEFVRYLVYLTTGKSLLIKSPAMLSMIKAGANRPDLVRIIEQIGLVKLSRVFFRFKKIFLALKTPKTAKLINKLRKMATKGHRPMKPGYFQELLNNPKLVTDLREKLEDCDNFTKIRLLQTMNIRNKNFPARFFPIRNGKLWVKEESVVTKKYFEIFYPIIYKSLIDSLKEKATTIKVPNGVSFKLPVSEKSYIGNFPIGTSFDIANKNAILGIHRLPEHSNGYFDFSLNKSNGEKIGWDSQFKDNECSLLFSGDICHNDRRKPAVELFYAKNGFKGNYIAKANNYDSWNSAKEMPFSVFLAIEEIDKITKNYMVDPNNVIFNIPLVAKDKEVSVGVIGDNKFILAEFRTGNKAVAGKSITNLYADYAIETADCYLDLETVLRDAGFEFTDNDTADIDLSLDKLSKDSILNILK